MTVPRGWTKKVEWPKTSLLIKNSQLLSNLHETWWKYSSQECFMLLEYQLDWIKIVDFLSIAKFFASANNFRPPSTFFSLYFIIVRFHLHEFEVPSHPSENRSTGLLCLFCQSQLYVRVWRSADATKVQDQPETQHLVCFHEIFFQDRHGIFLE